VAANQRDYAQAFDRLRDAERLMQQRQIPDTVYRSVLLQISSHFWLQQGRAPLACEALTRVLRHYRGPQARHAPPATVELIARIEYLLVLAETYLHQAKQPLERLKALLDQAQRHGRLALEAELQLAICEVADLMGETALAVGLAGRAGAGETLPFATSLVRTAPAPADIAQSIGRRRTYDAFDPGRQSIERARTGSAQPDCSGQFESADRRAVVYLAAYSKNPRATNSCKLGVERRTQAVAIAKKLGLISSG
jgi:ATP/maltotriose-dependent transcriptional regulator MalT